jgi:hypothetical protein
MRAVLGTPKPNAKAADGGEQQRIRLRDNDAVKAGVDGHRPLRTVNASAFQSALCFKQVSLNS